MKVDLNYPQRSAFLNKSGGQKILYLAPNLARDQVFFDAALTEPLRFREAISALHDVVINDGKYKPRDRTAYENWRRAQTLREASLRKAVHEKTLEQIQAQVDAKPSADLRQRFTAARRQYWSARAKLNRHLIQANPKLWRKLMPYDPIIQIGDEAVHFECFSADESSYGCLTLERESCFKPNQQAQLGTTNVDYSWDLYHQFQSLRSYRETRFAIDPHGMRVQTQQREPHYEEKIELPDGWLRGFVEMQSAMMLPMRQVTLSVDAVYSLLAFLRRHKAKQSPRAIRFELSDGESPKMVLEPWEQIIVSQATRYRGPTGAPIRVWGRQRLLTLARVLPLIERMDVYLLGTGLPSFWVARMGNMRLTLGLSGWTSNDWMRGSAVAMFLPPQKISHHVTASVAELLSNRRQGTLAELSVTLRIKKEQTAAALNQLALRGQAIYDLHTSQYRWRQILPMALSDKEIGPPHPEVAAAIQLVSTTPAHDLQMIAGPRGGTIVTGKVENQSCEALIDADGIIRSGKCLCSWHYKTGVRNGPCRHLQTLRAAYLKPELSSP